MKPSELQQHVIDNAKQISQVSSARPEGDEHVIITFTDPYPNSRIELTNELKEPKNLTLTIPDKTKRNGDLILKIKIST